jgi:hypothetical protein
METDEELANHVELVQAVINRMPSNSFLLKAWSVSLVVALFAFAAGCSAGSVY